MQFGTSLDQLWPGPSLSWRMSSRVPSCWLNSPCVSQVALALGAVALPQSPEWWNCRMHRTQLRQEMHEDVWRPGHSLLCGWMASLSSFLPLCILCNAFWKQSSRAILKQIDLHGHCFLQRNLGISKFTPLHLLWDHTLCTHFLFFNHFFFSHPLHSLLSYWWYPVHIEWGWLDECDPWLVLQP